MQEPTWESYAPPLCWSVETIFRFADRKYLRIWENYNKIARLEMSRKIQWSYHYGPIEATDDDGDVVQGSPDDPLDIRIDTRSGLTGLHLHYEKREPHINQEKVLGLDLGSVDWPKFVQGVLKHRKTGQPFTKIFGFKLK